MPHRSPAPPAVHTAPSSKVQSASTTPRHAPASPAVPRSKDRGPRSKHQNHRAGRRWARAPWPLVLSRKPRGHHTERTSISNHPTYATGVTWAFWPCQKYYRRTPYPPFLTPLSIGKGPYLFSRLILSALISFGIALRIGPQRPLGAARNWNQAARCTDLGPWTLDLGPWTLDLEVRLRGGKMLRPYTSVIIHYFRESGKREEAEERGLRGAERKRWSRDRQSWAFNS